MKNTLLITCCIIHLLLSGRPAKAQRNEFEPTTKNKIDKYLSEGVKNGFSGAILVAQNENIMINKGYGMAIKEKNTPYTTTTISTVGSVTKQFTATAILKLVELNKLDLSDSISSFFKGLPDNKKNITIHQLLTHSAGLVDRIGDGDFDDISRRRYFKALFSTKLLHEPGSKYAYSNSGYSILARIIEIVSRQEYERFLNEYLFKPAGMRKTGYLIPQWNEDSIASGYFHNITNVGTMLQRFKKMDKVAWTLKGNGGIHSTIEDMYKWYLALKNHVILPKGLVEKLTTPYIPENEDQSSYYAYGWAIYKSDRNTKIISHNGGNALFFHDFIWMPEEDVVIILFTNTSSRETEVAWPIKKMLFDKNYHPEAIKKDLYNLVFDNLDKDGSHQINQLVTRIEKRYKSYLKNSENLNVLGYAVLETEQNAELALALFKLNTTLFPTEGNLWDSLGEGYLSTDQKDKAIQSYHKALELRTEEDCFWCDSSSKALRDLRKGK